MMKFCTNIAYFSFIFYVAYVHEYCAHIMHFLCTFHCSLRILLCKDPYNFLISQITQPLTNHENFLECWQKPVYRFVIGFIKSYFLSIVCYID